MKSFVQEASTIVKAIEAAWVHAGKPDNFSVKILELPKKNFIGFTTHAAKVALFFEEKGQPEQRRQPHQRSVRQPQTQQPLAQQSPAQQPRPERKERPEQRAERGEKAVQVRREPAGREQQAPLWNEEFLAVARTWVGNMLALMGQRDMPYSVEQDGFTLKVLFKSPLMGSTKDSAQERKLLANFSILLMTALKKQFRKSLRGHKILFTHQ